MDKSLQDIANDLGIGDLFKSKKQETAADAFARLARDAEAVSERIKKS